MKTTNFWNKIDNRDVNHGEDFGKFASGIYTPSGNGFCARCAESLGKLEECSNYFFELKKDATIVCENCNADTTNTDERSQMKLGRERV